MSAAIYGEFTQEDLDREYNARLTVPDPGLYFNEYARASAEARSRLRSRLNLPYGDGGDERLDLFFANESAAPVIVFFHGGYWRYFTRADFSFVAPAFVAAGYHVAVVEYTLAPAVNLTEITRQACAALAHLRENASSYGITSFYVLGHSAGGQLAGIAAARDPAVAGCASISGLHDLEPVRRSYINEWMQFSDDEVTTLSPTRHVPAQRCPLMVAAGTRETSEFRRQAKLLAGAYESAGQPVLHLEPDENHYSIVIALGDPSHNVTKSVIATFA